MTQYKITQYTFQKAKQYGYTFKVATNTKKKLDVYKNGTKIASIGDSQYKDYPTYIIEKGISYANIRRALYRKRHAKDINVKGSNGHLSSILLW